MTKVFISWSGPTSLAVAETLYEWLPVIIQNIRPFISSEDLRKGGRWNKDLAEELQNTNFGIICLTPANLLSPWILFEAGTLSKFITESRISPLLISVKPSDLPAPLTQFNATLPEKDEVRKLLKSMSELSGDGTKLEIIERSFDACWPKIEESLQAAILKAQTEATKKPTGIPDKSPTSTNNQILEELILLARNQLKILNTPEQILPPEYLRSVIGYRESKISPAAIVELAEYWEILLKAAEPFINNKNKESDDLAMSLSAIRRPLEHILTRTGFKGRFRNWEEERLLAQRAQLTDHELDERGG